MSSMYQKTVKVGKRGQSTIPKAIREALKIAPGSKVIVSLEANRIIIKPVYDKPL